MKRRIALLAVAAAPSAIAVIAAALVSFASGSLSSPGPYGSTATASAPSGAASAATVEPRSKPLRSALRPPFFAVRALSLFSCSSTSFRSARTKSRTTASSSTLFRMCRRSATRPQRTPPRRRQDGSCRESMRTSTMTDKPAAPGASLPAPRPRNRAAGRARRRAGPSSRRHSPARALCPVEQPGVLHALCLARRELRVAAVE